MIAQISEFKWKRMQKNTNWALYKHSSRTIMNTNTSNGRQFKETATTATTSSKNVSLVDNNSHKRLFGLRPQPDDQPGFGCEKVELCLWNRVGASFSYSPSLNASRSVLFWWPKSYLSSNSMGSSKDQSFCFLAQERTIAVRECPQDSSPCKSDIHWETAMPTK